MATYPMPAWLNRPTTTAQQYATGLRLGASIAQEQNRLKASAAQAAMQAQLRREQIQHEALRQEQELEMQKAWQDAQIGLRRSALALQEKQVAIKTKQAAQQFAAQRKYEGLLASGMSAPEAMLRVGPEMGMSMAGAGTLARAMAPRPDMLPPEVTEFEGRKFLKIPTSTGGFRYQQLGAGPQEGPIQSVPVLSPEGRPIKGMVGVPTATGGYEARNLPDRQLRYAAQKMRQIENGVFGVAILMGTPPKNEAWIPQYKATLAEYNRLKKIVESGGEDMSPYGEAAPKAAYRYNPKTHRIEKVTEE